MSKLVITYGTFDLFHIGHLRFLERARALGDSLIVGVSTDEFNAVKGKKAFIKFCHRLEIVRSMRCVDAVFPETCWEQKLADVTDYKAEIFTIGNDWAGNFDFLKGRCEVVYLPRTDAISSTELRARLISENAIQKPDRELRRGSLQHPGRWLATQNEAPPPELPVWAQPQFLSASQAGT